jgi:hypothetical protein
MPSAEFISAQSSRENSPASLANTKARPNLVPTLHNPMTDEVRVRNLGTGHSAPSKLTLDCERVEANPELRACPDLSPSLAETYFDSVFPKYATIKVPVLAPGTTFTHKLSFWNQMNWRKGTYRFTAVLRSSDSGQETITKDKVAVTTLVIP